ncbi:hypothetical protein U0C82_07050 [Fulvimarina sp. 2208YS6-2-32]|uniref:Uncharacterized protein n=1 Tax=Fulvimarina uroteuthidis TaxID=3098149 RepID=A0ABU5I0J3_9HYPH|nr:hypothetical protein [Fulvimarina sp. 2208YS6-2-32]MDY8108900.1 hypothetical protein [Fulvimarina sp. 2208YS6-2-32]
MVARRKADAAARLAACTQLPYDAGFDMGATLGDALRPAGPDHPYCATFCGRGGASCTA